MDNLLPRFSACILLAGLYNCHPFVVGNTQQLEGELADGKKIKRSSITVGDKAVQYLLKEAKFLSNAGLSRVYTKPGGYSKALADFTEVNTAKDVLKQPVPGAFYAQSLGRAGNRQLYLMPASPDTGYSTLTIHLVPQLGGKSNIDSLLSQVIIYTD